MVLKTTVMNPEELALDPQNPRLWRLEAQPGTQEELEEAVNENRSTAQICEAMLTGRYQAPEPLLVIRQRPGHIVIDGNRRLTAIRMAAKHKRGRNGAAAASLREIPVAIMRSRETARSVQIRRHRLQGTEWTPIIVAMDMKERLSKGHARRRIANHYGLPADEETEREISRMARCLHLAESSATGRQNTARAFHWILAGSRHPHINAAIDAGTESYSTGLSPETETRLEQYLSLTLGYAGPHPETLTRRITHTRELGKLDAIFGNEETLEQLMQNPTETVEYAHARLTGQRTEEQTKETLVRFRQAAIDAVNEITLTRAGAVSISVEATALAFSEELGEHLTATIQVAGHAGSRTAPLEVQDRLHRSGYPTARITLAR